MKYKPCNDVFAELEAKYAKGKNVRKIASFVIGVGIGFFIGSGRMGKLLGEGFKKVAELTPEGVKNFFRNSFLGKLFHGGKGGILDQKIAKPVEPLKPKPMPVHIWQKPLESVGHLESVTVPKGSNMWDTLRGLVKSGKLTEEQFGKLWGSQVDVGGKKIPVFELHRVPAGAKVSIDLENMRLSVTDAKGGFSGIGGAQELYNDYVRLGKPAPRWLTDELNLPPEGVSAGVPEHDLGMKLMPSEFEKHPFPGYGYEKGQITSELLGRKVPMAYGEELPFSNKMVTVESLTRNLQQSVAEMKEMMKRFGKLSLADQENMFGSIIERNNNLVNALNARGAGSASADVIRDYWDAAKKLGRELFENRRKFYSIVGFSEEEFNSFAFHPHNTVAEALTWENAMTETGHYAYEKPARNLSKFLRKHFSAAFLDSVKDQNLGIFLKENVKL